MDPISHFRSLDDLIRTLDRERKLRIWPCFKIVSDFPFVVI